MKNRFVAWGTGFRAEAVSNVIEDSIIAYIDNNREMQGSVFQGKNVISFEQYLLEYREYPIIVTPVYAQNDICRQMEESNINNYFLLQKNPPEFFGYGIKNLWNYAIPYLLSDKRNVIVGDNLYAVLMYEKAINKGFDVKLCILDWFSRAFIQYVNDKQIQCCKVEEIQTGDNVLSCVPRGMFDKGTNIFDLSSVIPDYWHTELENLKNTHVGESCFIVATGPSLEVRDLLKIRDAGSFTFSVNRIFEVGADVWTPNCYVFTDKKGIMDYADRISAYDVPEKILTDELPEDIPMEGNIKKIHVVGTNDYDTLPDFSEDISKRVYGFATVTYSVLQIAVYMGFKTIYLLGVDCNYTKGSSKNYFVESKEVDTLDHHTSQMIQAYEAAKQYADSHDIKIYNATRGGMLEVFERVDFDSLFEG